MYKSSKDKKQAENEVVFRKANQEVATKLKEVERAAEADGDYDLVPDTELELLFYCECSDENCRQRIKLKPSEYERLHKNPRQFITLPGHQAPNIERVEKKTKKFNVVEKFITPKYSVNELKET
jgi:hypothetical protein